jgi:hypothetical protein
MKDNGVLWALGAVGAVAAASMARRGSAAYDIERLTEAELDQIRAWFDAPIDGPEQARIGQALAQRGIDPMDYGDEGVWRQGIRRKDAWISRHLGPDVGLNADWSFSAWHVGKIDDGGHRYILDNEDDTYSLVERWNYGHLDPVEQANARRAYRARHGNLDDFDYESDYIEDLEHFADFEALKQWVRTHHRKRIR